MWKIKLNPNTEEFKRSKLLRKYIVKILFGWDNKKFENEYLKKLERNWQRWKSVSLEETPWRGNDVRVINKRLGFILFSFSFIFLYFDKGKEDKTWCHIGVTWWSHNSHTHVMQWNNVEGFKNNDVI